MPSFNEEQPAKCDGNHGPDECKDCLAEMSAPIAVPAWLAAEMDDFNERQAYAAAWEGR